MNTTSSGTGVLSNYEILAEQEARFWGSVQPSAENPQLWDDPFLFEIFLKPQWDRLIKTVCALGEEVLEVGCGEGNLSIELATKGLHVHGLDISAERICRGVEKSKQLLHSTAWRLPDFEVADLNTKQLQPDRYDVVVAHDALHHILDLEHLLDEIHRALRPGGSFIVYDYVGMSGVRKVLAAFLYAVLPTYQPYRMKLRLAKRLTRFMQSEEGKRHLLARTSDISGNESPFEEISAASIVRLMEKKFDVIDKQYFHPFFYYLAPKVRLPQRFRKGILRSLAIMDEKILQMKLSKGAYVYLVAKKRS